MIAPGMVLIFAGYALGSWGFCLVKGWNIPLRSWVSPLNPWQWPSGDVPTVPPGQIMPGAAPFAGIGQGTQAIGNAAQQAAQGAQQIGSQAGGNEGQASPWSQIGNAAIQAGNAAQGL